MTLKSMHRDDAESLADDAYQRGFLDGFEKARKAMEERVTQASQEKWSLETLLMEISNLNPP